MIQLTPQMKVRLHIEPVDFRNGIDGLRGLCRRLFEEDPFSGKVFLFCNRHKTAIKILVYDGQGFWLCQKRLSSGRFRHWPRSAKIADELCAREVSVLLMNGDPMTLQAEWKKVI